MEFRILGPLEATGAGGEIPLGSRKQRAVLAILLLRANEVVSPDALIDDLWGEHPPPSAPHTLQVYVSRLRSVLRAAGASDGVLVTRPGGYLLRVGFGELDLHRFEQLAEDGRRALAAESFDRAAEKLGSALGQWRGRALADLEFEPFARVEVERLEERRLLAVEDMIDAELGRARHSQVIPDLEALVVQHPLRERLRGQLMLALYRSGRQADALAAFQDGRDYLGEELGLEPGSAMRELQHAILRQDGSLEPPENGHGSSPVITMAAVDAEAPTAAVARDAGSDAVGGPRGRRWTVAAVAAAAGALALAGVTAFALEGSGRAAGLAFADVHANAIVSASFENATLLRQTDVPGRPTAMSSGAGALWVTDAANSRVLKLDPESDRVEDQIPVGNDPVAIVATPDAVWVANSGSGTVSRISPTAGAVVDNIAVGNVPAAIAAGSDAIWVADASDGSLRRIDARSDSVVATVELAQPLSGVAVGLDAVWVTSASAGLLFRVDSRSNRPVQTIAVGNGPSSVAVAAGAVWVANEPDDTVSRVDGETGAVRKLDVAAPGQLLAAHGSLWVARPGLEDVLRLDPHRLTTGSTVRTGAPIGALAATAGRLVFATTPTLASHRGGTLRVVGGYELDSVDPGDAWTPIGWQLLSLTNDGLLTYARTPGASGAAVVPDLAVSLPTVQDGGRVFTFRLRAGVRYSTGAFVRPADIRSTMEREYRASTGLAALGVPIVGSDRCSSSRCDLAAGIAVDDAQRVVTFRLSRPDPSFLYKLALPFGAVLPAGSRPIGTASTPLAATGPYRIGRYDAGGQVTLVRNPRFQEWAPAAQPAGFPDRIVVSLNLDPAEQAAAVSAGRADTTLDSPPPKVLARLAVRAPLRLHANPTSEVEAVFLNTRTAPFNRPAVRRALAFAIDRAAIVGSFGGPSVARATCQILPADFPGYRPTCPYTTSPSPAGAWNAPDTSRATRLVARSGTRGMEVAVSTYASDSRQLAVGRYFVHLLRTLGYRSRLRLYYEGNTYYNRVGAASSKSQLGVFDWIADYQAGSAFFGVLFTCAAYRPARPLNLNAAGFCDRGVDARIARATRLEGRNSALANVAWSRIDRELTRRAPWIPLVNPIAVDYVAQRVGNYQRHPVFGILLDHLWVR
jgi:peptide/nickel transport system substrate-binding protein